MGMMPPIIPIESANLYGDQGIRLDRGITDRLLWQSLGWPMCSNGHLLVEMMKILLLVIDG